MNFVRICAVALAVLAASGCSKKIMPPVPDGSVADPPCGNVAPWGFPQQNAQANPTQESRRSRRRATQSIGFVCHEGQYALGYDQSLRVSRWATEIVSPKMMQGEPARVRKDWRPDPFIPAGLEVSPGDYSREITQGAIVVKSLASHKNYANNEVLVGRTFYMSNTMPAIKKDEVDGAWERLEDQVVRWSAQKGDLLVISGPVYMNGTPLGWTGPKQKQRSGQEPRGLIAIPSHFYKVIVDLKTKEAIAFQVPNDDSAASSLGSMAKRVSDIERSAGITFFPAMQAEEREKLVNNVNVRLWPIQ